MSTTRQGHEGASLDAQREAIRIYADNNDLEIVRWYEEMSTAAKTGRPAFRAMMRLLRAGKARGVLVHKIDRSARNLHDWAGFAALADSGVEIHFCHEQLDLHSRGGRLSADIQAVVAADYVRNLREEALKGVQARLRQGIWPFRAFVGYLDMGSGQPKAVDRQKAPLVSKLFKLYATGEHGYHSLVRESARMGLTNVAGGPMTVMGVAAILRNPFYAGTMLVRSTGETHPGAHEPIVSAGLFKRVQQVREGRLKPRPRRHKFAYSRLIRCESCGRHLIAEMQKGRAYYRCHQSTCPTTCIREDHIDKTLADVVAAIRLPRAVTDEFKTLLRRQVQISDSEAEQETKSIALQVAQAEAQLERLLDLRLAGELESRLFLTRKAKLLQRKKELEQRRDSLKSHDATRAREQILDKLELLEDAGTKVRHAKAQYRRRILRSMTSNRVANGRNVVFTPSLAFQPLVDWKALSLCRDARELTRTSKAKIAGLDKLASQLMIAATKVEPSLHPAPQDPLSLPG